jgi:hypothetical protein
MSVQLFNTVANRDVLGFANDYQKIANFLDFDEDDLSKIAQVRRQRVRLDEPPREVSDRLREFAIIANLVAEFFDGDAERTAAWFHAKNPVLGNVRPRDMLRLGRFDKLYQFVLEAREEAGWGHA